MGRWSRNRTSLGSSSGNEVGDDLASIGEGELVMRNNPIILPLIVRILENRKRSDTFEIAVRENFFLKTIGIK